MPMQKLDFLGLFLDLNSMTVSLPPNKMQSLPKSIGQTLSQGKVSIRQLARLLGSMVASHLAILLAPLHYRFLERVRRRVLRSQASYIKVDQHMEGDLT